MGALSKTRMRGAAGEWTAARVTRSGAPTQPAADDGDSPSRRGLGGVRSGPTTCGVRHSRRPPTAWVPGLGRRTRAAAFDGAVRQSKKWEVRSWEARKGPCLQLIPIPSRKRAPLLPGGVSVLPRVLARIRFAAPLGRPQRVRPSLGRPASLPHHLAAVGTADRDRSAIRPAVYRQVVGTMPVRRGLRAAHRTARHPRPTLKRVGGTPATARSRGGPGRQGAGER